MRFSSSVRSSLAILLSLAVPAGSVRVPSVRAEPPPDPCLIFKVSSASIPAGSAAPRLSAVGERIAERLRVRWVAPASPGPPEEGEESFPVAGKEDVARVSGMLAEAIRRMESMETGPAARILSDALRLARSFRFGDTMRPYVAEIFLRQGVLRLWEGETGVAEDLFSRSRALRPEFSPDPALFSPRFLEAWNRSRERAPAAELLVESVPPGAEVRVGDREAGVTPCRVRVRQWGPIRIRVSAEGYRTAVRTGQWLPGDFEALAFSLVREDAAALAELLSSSPDGREAGPLLSRLLLAAGAGRAVLLLLERGEDGEELRVLSQDQGDDAPATLGTIPFPAGDDGAGTAGEAAAVMLAEAGWPRRDDAKATTAPWYRSWMFWTLVGAAVAGIAVAAGGGGGGGGSSAGGSTGTIGVDF